MLHDLSGDGCEDYGYNVRVDFSGDKGRPKIVITSQMLDSFFGHGFLVSTTACLLHENITS